MVTLNSAFSHASFLPSALICLISFRCRFIMTDRWEKMTNLKVDGRVNTGNRENLGSFLKARVNSKYDLKTN